MAIFDQRKNLTFGNDLFRMIIAMQEMNIRKDDLKMRQQEHKLKVEESEFAANQRQGAMQQILKMPGALDNVSPGAANQIADAGQAAPVATAQVTREAATGALKGGDFADAAVAAQYLGLPPAIPLAIQAEERRSAARKGLEVMLGDQGSEWLDAVFTAEQAGSPVFAKIFSDRYMEENPSAIQTLQMDQIKADIARTRATTQKIFLDLEMAPLEYDLRKAQLDLATTSAERDRIRMGMEIEMFPLQVETARADLDARGLANDLSRALNPLRVTGAVNALILDKYNIEEKTFISDERAKALNGETEPQVALRSILTHPAIGFTGTQADGIVRGMDRQSAARAVLAMREIELADEKERRSMAFSLFREFAMPHLDPITQQWNPPAISDPQQIARIVGTVYGDMLPVDETAAIGIGVMYSLIAGGEDPTDPSVLTAVEDEVVISLDAALTSNGTIPANAMTEAEKGELRKALDQASTSNTLLEAYESMQMYLEKAPKLQDLRRRLNANDAGNRLKTLMSEYIYQRNVERDVPRAARANPLTIEDIGAIPD